VRILHVLDHSLPLHSGYAFRTAAILREQRALGWETCQVTTPRQQGAAEVEDAGDFRFQRTHCAASPLDRAPGVRYLREMAATTARLRELIGAFRPDVLHAHSPVLDLLPALRAARTASLPVVYEMRALWEDAAVDHGTTREGSARYRASRALETFALRRADHVTTICEGLRAEIAARGIDPSRVTVVPNAVDPERFRFAVAGDPVLRARLGLSDATVVGFAGSFYGYEGLDLLVDALGRLAVTQPGLRLLLVGGGPQEAALRAQVEGLGLSGRVVFTGRVPHDEVQRYYELIDVLAYPRRRMRLTDLVTPLKPLEAMAQGRMLVASDVGGHRELVRDGETGFMFPAGDAAALAAAIGKVLDARPRWPAIAAAARAFVERERTWAKSVAAYASVYHSLTRGRPHPAALPASR
jgi:PEP-CTERM/exosortase A-associated glycosyltransferase